MIMNVTDPEKYLYHYTSAGTAIAHILKNQTLRLSPYTSTNDPKESKQWLFDFISYIDNSDLAEQQRDEMSEWLSGALKRDTRLVCFSRDTNPLTGNHLLDIFNRGYCKPRMWAQYGDKHKGVCLVFDSQRLQQQIGAQLAAHAPLMRGAVQYRDRGIAGDIFDDHAFTINVDELKVYGKDGYPGVHLTRHHHKLFFEKMTDWAAEDEYRWIAFSKSPEPLHLSYGNALVGIMFGDDTSDDHKREVAKLTSGKGIELRSLRWKNHSPWYDFERSNYN